MEGSLEQLAQEGDRTVSPDFPFIDGITDVAIIVQTTILYVNKGVLCVASPVFHTMLTSEFKEKNGVINLPEKKVEDVTLLMKMIYPSMHLSLDGKAKIS
ncbi:hypothetical protein FSP39_017029 [Pinctada imbricata]|uniref:BTB domain-containing protein n=1 Tax=Pinctada imbricata TaxID=66713 RepID=A0AA88Y8X6_PINIB|nr:hypothetical protein FSP39_017029 [Pinctada imbricata]